MKNQMILMSVCNQKGGIGKSTFTVLLASYLNYELGRNTVVVDCDYPQWSVYTQRERETAILHKNDYYKLKLIRQHREKGCKLWPVVNTVPEKALGALDEFLATADRQYEFVLFDMPGTLNSKGVPALLAGLDYVFVPMKADKMVMESTINFARTIHEQLVIPNDKNTKGVYLFWSMIDKRERTPLYGQYDRALDIFGLPRLETHIPDRSRFNKEILAAGGPISRSTVFPPDKSFIAETCLDELVREILEIVKPAEDDGRQ